MKRGVKRARPATIAPDLQDNALVPCPVCGRQTPMLLINQHLDTRCSLGAQAPKAPASAIPESRLETSSALDERDHAAETQVSKLQAAQQGNKPAVDARGLPVSQSPGPASAQPAVAQCLRPARAPASLGRATPSPIQQSPKLASLHRSASTAASGHSAEQESCKTLPPGLAQQPVTAPMLSYGSAQARREGTVSSCQETASSMIGSILDRYVCLTASECERNTLSCPCWQP